MLNRLHTYGVTRALVFGSYAEASPDVHHLIDALATRQAGRSWRLMGARSAAEARSYFVSRTRRFVGVFTAREMARHRLHRVPPVGVPRAVLDARRAQQQGWDRMAPVGAVEQGQLAAQDFFAYQARVPDGGFLQ